MKTSHADIIMVPGWSGSGPEHWQSRWAAKLSTAVCLEQEDWVSANKTAWTEKLVQHVDQAKRPVVLVAHSLGVITVVHAATELAKSNIAGAYLVAPADVDNAQTWPVTQGETFCKDASGFTPIPTAKLPFKAVVVGSRNDPYCSFARAKSLSADWGAAFTDAGDAEHINVASGHGPWPEGLLRFAGFIKEL